RRIHLVRSVSRGHAIWDEGTRGAPGHLSLRSVRPSLKNPEINVRGLARRFAQTIAVDHIDLTVAEGDIFGLLGANGAGKSTVIKMLTTLLGPSAGSATVAGFD